MSRPTPRRKDEGEQCADGGVDDGVNGRCRGQRQDARMRANNVMMNGVLLEKIKIINH